MDEDLLNILSHSNKDIDNQKLMDYLSDKLSAEEKHEFERTLIDSGLESDAVDGLVKFKNKKDPLLFAEELNRNLQKHLRKKKEAKEKRRIREIPILYLTIIFLIFIIIVVFFIVWKYLH